MRKIILFGSNGMLGNYINSYLCDKYHVIPLTRDDLDISLNSDDDILKFIKSYVDNNSIIINACGIIKQRGYNSIDMIKVNSLFPHLLSKIKDEIGCQVVHITTDCVFNGIIGSYSEGDIHDAHDDYGKSKSLGEPKNTTNIRTSIIGEEKLNKKSLLEWVKSKEQYSVIEGYINHKWNGLTCLELSKVIDNIITENNFWVGTRHIHSPDTVTKYDLVYSINEIYKLNLKIRPTRTTTHCYRNLISNYSSIVKKSIHEQIVETYEFNLKNLNK